MAYVERWISPEGFLKLMKGVENRKAKFVDCTAYCEPGKEPISFVAETPGIISEKLEGKYGWGSDFFIRLTPFLEGLRAVDRLVVLDERDLAA